MSEPRPSSICELCRAELDPEGSDAVRAALLIQSYAGSEHDGGDAVLFHGSCFPAGSPRYERLDSRGAAAELEPLAQP